MCSRIIFRRRKICIREIRLQFDSDSLVNTLSSNLASAYSNSKDYQKAIQFYEKMLLQDTTQYYIRYQIGILYDQMGDYKKSLNEYMKIIKSDSNYADAYVQIGKIYYSKFNNIKKAKRYFRKLMRRNYT